MLQQAQVDPRLCVVDELTMLASSVCKSGGDFLTPPKSDYVQSSRIPSALPKAGENSRFSREAILLPSIDHAHQTLRLELQAMSSSQAYSMTRLIVPSTLQPSAAPPDDARFLPPLPLPLEEEKEEIYG
ncbi:hypothetical protein EJ03DRAFT_356463 [Teratosphaeria nubilosa]|uniref:Uncharacterized protein n=1 Tax=Teratosphaeria nubilosa TaxID=161662 RepID=A0A6G1KSN2_9PEZI|nr:hypothetical protein EJ03DRAFT_356463 [Teratosphaeria nubilosa]